MNNFDILMLGRGRSEDSPRVIVRKGSGRRLGILSMTVNADEGLI